MIGYTTLGTNLKQPGFSVTRPFDGNPKQE
jgi:hypothetical protein